MSFFSIWGDTPSMVIEGCPGRASDKQDLSWGSAACVASDMAKLHYAVAIDDGQDQSLRLLALSQSAACPVRGGMTAMSAARSETLRTRATPLWRSCIRAGSTARA
jgi:hypothetical protein